MVFPWGYVYDMSFYIFMWKLDDSHAWSWMTQQNFRTTAAVATTFEDNGKCICFVVLPDFLCGYSKFCTQKMQKKMLTGQKYTVFYYNGLVIDKKKYPFFCILAFRYISISFKAALERISTFYV